MFRKVLFNTGWQVVGKIVTAFSTLLITLIIGKSLGPSGFGEFTKIFVFVGYFYIIADFGLNSIYVKYARSTSEVESTLHLGGEGSLFRALLGLRVVISIFLVTSAILVTFFLPHNPQTLTGFSPLVKTGIMIASLTIITQALFTTGNGFFQKNLRYDLSAIAAISGSLVMVLATAIVYFTTRSLLLFVSIYILGGLTYVAAAFFLISKKFDYKFFAGFDLTKSKALLLSAWPIGLALILNLLYFRADVFILASFRSSAEVGLFALGYQFFEAALAVPIFFANALYPLLSVSFAKNIEEFKRIVRKWVLYLVAFSIILTIFLLLISFLIPLLYDSRFEDSKTALQILALGMPFFFLSALFWHVLIIYNKQKLLIYVYAAGAIFNLTVNLIFIPVFGYRAAAITTVISEAFIMLLLVSALKLKIRAVSHD